MDSREALEHLPLTPNTFQILVSLAKGPQHGWAIRREVEERTGGAIRLGAGTLYTALQRLEGTGLIEEVPCPDELADEASSRWRFYSATELGRTVLAADAERLDRAARAARVVLGES